MKKTNTRTPGTPMQVLGIPLLFLGVLVFLSVLLAHSQDDPMLPRSELRNPMSSVGMYFSYYLVNFGLGRIFSLVFPLLLIQAGWLMMREESFWERWPRWLGQVGLALAGAFTLSLFLARGLHEGATSGGWWVGSYVVLLSGYLIERASLVGAVLIVLAFDLIVVSLVFAISPIHWTDIVGNLGTRLHERWLDWGVARAERREAREREEAKAQKEMAAAEAFAAAEEIRLEKLRRKEEETQRREEEIQRRHAQEEERDRLREEIRLRSETPVTPTPEPGLFDEEFEDDGEEPSDSPGGEGGKPNPTVPFEVTEEVIEEEKRFEAEKVREYRYKPPPVSLLNNPPDDEYHVTTEDMETVSRMLEHTLKDFNVDAKVVHVNPGPVITRYDLEPAAGVKVSRIVTLADDLALALRAERIRIIAPVPEIGRAHV